MVPNKFENHIQKQFEEREIQPSSEAWLKLGNRLDEMPISGSKKRAYIWYAAAACLIGLIILSVVFFRSTTTMTASDIQVVDEEMKAIDEFEDVETIKNRENALEVVIVESVPDEKMEVNGKEVNREVAKKEIFIEQLADASNEVKYPLTGSAEDIINTKVNQVIAQVNALEEEKEQLTDAEVDSLLRRAQEEILRNKLFRSDHSVDAMALLSEVEHELDKSFRDQIFESLKSGFFKVRTAVVDRNN